MEVSVGEMKVAVGRAGVSVGRIMVVAVGWMGVAVGAMVVGVVVGASGVGLVTEVVVDIGVAVDVGAEGGFGDMVAVLIYRIHGHRPFRKVSPPKISTLIAGRSGAPRST